MKEQSSRLRLTVGRVADFACQPGKSQAFLWDTDATCLALRVTPTGRKTYVFEARLNGTTIRMAIGTATDWTLPQARSRAQAYKVLVDRGVDPRQLERDELAAAVAKREADARLTATVGGAWSAYIAERSRKWSAHHLDDHMKLAQAGGEVRRNRKGVLTIAGPLAPLMPLPLREVDAALVLAWAEKEAAVRPARVRLALRILKAFLRWCAAEPAYKEVTDSTAASSTKTRETVGKGKPKNDNIQREQLGLWFDSVRGIQNQVISTYLQCLLLTGARREELAGLRWDDVNFQWKTIAMKDKIEGERMVPLTPYVSHLLVRLPRRNEWVFSAPAAASGRLAEPSIAHRRACATVGLDGLTLHGLRRSFASLCEWLDIPGGISAQIQGHAPQGVREQNYIRRPLDLLRLHHEKIETWMLDQARVQFDPATAGEGGLRLVEQVA